MARSGVDTLLKDYRGKRDFTLTDEPDHAPAGSKAADKLAFVVQKHDASRLHYDFRLEWEGVLKSWAVTKGPSLDPSDKRLAVRTEDHPLSYGDFEGTIPEGHYGGGTVMLWDRGTWEPEEDPEEGLKKGKLSFTLKGKRLKGSWALVRMRSRKGEKRENWLLIKHDDRHADTERDVLETTRSVKSRRAMETIAREGRSLRPSDMGEEADKPRRAGKGTKTASIPKWREPQLATLVGEAPEGDEWLAEMKYDGYRALIAVGGGKAKVWTRNGKDWTDRFTDIADAAAALPVKDALLDGEIVAFGPDGGTDFSTLQAAIKEGGPMACFVFDLLRIDGEDITGEPLRARKERLAELLGKDTAPLIYSQHIEGKAVETHRHICQAGHEGIVAKKADSKYRSGRGRDWVKVKCTRRQEFVIGGFSPSDKRGRPFASLLVGTYEEDRLVYQGRVGTGFDGDEMDRLADLFGKRARKTSPFDKLPSDVSRSARFVTPDLVAEVDFAEFTADGAIRHGAYQGLREDKAARDIVLETGKRSQPAGGQGMVHEQRDRIAGVKLSSPDKVVFAGQGVTKADLAAHYERVAERMLPYVTGRPLSLVRCPDGETGACFFQKHGRDGLPAPLKPIEIDESKGGSDSYIYIDGLDGLVAGVQMGTLEFHIWGSRNDRLDRPDRLVFDLDPDEGLGFDDVKAAAVLVRDRLAKLGLKTVPMLTGGKGVHVIAPVERRAGWDDVKAFTAGFAKALAEEDPDHYIAKSSKAARKGRIFIDYLRNDRGSTAIAPFSSRAREGCPIATPVSWKELDGIDRANCFGIGDMEKRLAGKDPWAGSEKWRQSVTAEMVRRFT